MSRKQGLLIVFAVAACLGFLLTLAMGTPTAEGSAMERFILTVIGKALGLFIFPGFLPCIAWAFWRFRVERLRPVLVSWIALQILFALASYFLDIRTAAAG